MYSSYFVFTLQCSILWCSRWQTPRQWRRITFSWKSQTVLSKPPVSRQYGNLAQKLFLVPVWLFYIVVLTTGTNLSFQIVCMDSTCTGRKLYIASFFPLWYRARNILWLWFFISIFKRQQTSWWVTVLLFFGIIC